MARVMLATSAEKGHVNPMVGVAQHLLAEGHAVGWMCLGRAPPLLAALGVEVFEVSSAFEEGLRGAAMAAMVRQPVELARWLREMLLGSVEGQVDELRACFRRWRASVVAPDPMLYAAIIAAALEGLPWAGISSSLNPVAPGSLPSAMRRTISALEEERTALFARHGLRYDFRLCDCLSPYLTTVFTTRAFVGDASLPPATRLVGPSSPRGPRGDDPPFDGTLLDASRPWVVCSFGSQIAWQPDIFRKLAAAAEHLGVQLVINGGPEVAKSALELPGRPLIAPAIPQRSLLARARFLVTHGGANSVMEALCEGVPMLVSPVCNDQPTQAWFVERAGVGRALDLAQAAPEEVEAVLRALLSEEAPERARALDVASSYRLQDGAREAAALIAALARS